MAFNLTLMNKHITNIKINTVQAKSLEQVIKNNHEHLHKIKTFLYNAGDQMFTIHNN